MMADAMVGMIRVCVGTICSIFAQNKEKVVSSDGALALKFGWEMGRLGARALRAGGYGGISR